MSSDQQQQKNPGITSYDPDAIESYQFCVSSKCGDLLVGIIGKELVGFAVEKEAPSTSFFFETLEQVARCVTICKTSGTEVSKEWIVAVGGDQKFVDIYIVTLTNHVTRCQAHGRVGPYPKRIQSLTFLNEERRLLLVADRFGDVYHCNAMTDAKPELMTKRDRQQRSGSNTPRHQSSQQQDSDAAESCSPTSPSSPSSSSSSRHFALQHFGLISTMRVIPCHCPSSTKLDFSPLLISCDGDHHVRASCGRRPGLLLQNLWPEFTVERQEGSISNSTNDRAACSSPSLSSSPASSAPSYCISTAGKSVSAISYFEQPSTSAFVVVGRCDGTLSAWKLIRRDVEHLDLNGTATCRSQPPAVTAASGVTPIIGVACLKFGSSELVIFAKSDSNKLYGWTPSFSASSATSRIRSVPETSQEQTCFPIAQVKDSQIKTHNTFSNHTHESVVASSSSSSLQASLVSSSSSSSSSNPSSAIVALHGCSAVSPSAVIVVFRDATVELLDIFADGASSFSCRPIPFPASGSHTRVPLPFSYECRAQLSRAKADATYSIVSNAIATDFWQSKFANTWAKKKKAAASGADDGQDNNEDSKQEQE